MELRFFFRGQIFSGGRIKTSEITNHNLTNIYACEQFLGKIFEIDKENNTVSKINF